MALVSIVVRDGVCQLYNGKKILSLPGVVAKESGEWFAGTGVLTSTSARFRVEEADAAAYSAVLREGVAALRMVGVFSVVFGMEEPDYTRLGKQVGQAFKELCGGRVLAVAGDHGAFFAVALDEQGQPLRASPSNVTVVRAGGRNVRVVRVVDFQVTESLALSPGWEEAVVFPAVRKAFAAGERVDVHTASWDLFRSPLSKEALQFGRFIVGQLAGGGEEGPLAIAGVGAKAIRQVVQASGWPIGAGDSEFSEVVGLWRWGRFKGLE